MLEKVCDRYVRINRTKEEKRWFLKISQNNLKKNTGEK